MLASTFFVAMLDNWIHQLCEFIFKRTKPQMTTDSEEQLVNPSLASSSLESQEVRNRKNIESDVKKCYVGGDWKIKWCVFPVSTGVNAI